MIAVRSLIAAAFLGLLALPAFADEAEETAARDAAIGACSAFNEYGPVTVESAAADGMGDWVVWITDKDSDLWMCNANAAGDVYVNVLMEGDLLKGDGDKMIALVPDAEAQPEAGGPAARAERLCSAVGAVMGTMTIEATASDGMGDYLVWMKSGEDTYFACNASSEAELYAFEPVETPLEEGADKPATDVQSI